MIPFDIGINFLTAAIGNFLPLDIALIYLVALAMVGMFCSYFCEMCWRAGGTPKEYNGVPANA